MKAGISLQETIDGFAGPFAIANWAESVNAGTTTLWDISNVPTSVTLKTYRAWKQSSDAMSTKASAAGKISFQWTGPSSHISDCPVSYMRNGQSYQLNANGDSSGQVELTVDAGDTLGFQVGLTTNLSSDDFFLKISNFSFTYS